MAVTASGLDRGSQSWNRTRLPEPAFTEKGTHQFTRYNAYPFQVNLWATKDQIRRPSRSCSTSASKKVRTQNRLGKKRRYRSRLGRLPNWKKAIVTLNAEDRIEFF